MKQETQFSLFRALTTSKPSGLVTLAEVYRLITTDATLKENTGKFRYFRSQGFDKDADEIKRSRCLAFTPAAVFNGSRSKKNVVAYTQYSLVDIDGLEEGQAEQLMERLKEDPYWLLAYITLSGKGLRIIFQVKRGNRQCVVPQGILSGQRLLLPVVGYYPVRRSGEGRFPSQRHVPRPECALSGGSQSLSGGL